MNSSKNIIFNFHFTFTIEIIGYVSSAINIILNFFTFFKQLYSLGIYSGYFVIMLTLYDIYALKTDFSSMVAGMINPAKKPTPWKISDHQQSWEYEDSPWKGLRPPLLVVADF